MRENTEAVPKSECEHRGREMQMGWASGEPGLGWQVGTEVPGWAGGRGRAGSAGSGEAGEGAGPGLGWGCSLLLFWSYAYNCSVSLHVRSSPGSLADSLQSCLLSFPVLPLLIGCYLPLWGQWIRGLVTHHLSGHLCLSRTHFQGTHQLCLKTSPTGFSPQRTTVFSSLSLPSQLSLSLNANV